MSGAEREFFAGKPEQLALYESVKARITALVGEYELRVKKTQIAFWRARNFAICSLPYRPIKGVSRTALILTLGLGRHAEHPRLWQWVEPYPGRFTHHFVIEDAGEEFGDGLEALIREAYAFAGRPRR